MLSSEMRNFITDLKDGSLEGLVIGDRDGLILLGAVINQMEGAYNYILWNSGVEGRNGVTANTAVAPIALAAEHTVKLAMCNGENAINSLSQGNQVTVTVSGTATNKLIDAGAGFVAGPVVVTLVDGEATLTTKADYATTETLILTLSAPSAGKTADGTYTITAP